MDNKCSVLYPHSEFNDSHGCIKPYAHNDAHIFLTDDGRKIQWEDDYKCDCGCWNDFDEGDGDVCIIYSEID